MAASTWTWLGGTGLSTTAANWSLTSGAGNALGYPAPGDTVIVPSGIIQDGLSELSGTGFVTLQAGAQIQVTAPGDSMSLGSVIGTSGTLTVTGPGSLLDVNGSALALFLGNAGTGVVNVQNAGSVVANTLLMGGNFSTPNGGKGTLALTGGSQVEVLDSMAVWSGSTLSVDPSSGFDMGNIGNFIGGAVIVDPGQTLTGDGLIAAALINNGVVQVNASHAISNAPGTMEITGAVSGSGTLSLAPASVLKLDGAVAASQNVVFQSGGGGALILNNVSPGTITNSISGLNIGDAINFAGLTSISNVQVSGGGGTVTVTTNLGDYVFNNVTFAPGAFHGFFSFFNGSTGDWQIQVAPQQVTWTGATNTDLGVAANWNPNGIPTTIERTNFNLNAGGTLTGTGNESSAFFSGTGTWTLQGATLNLTGEPSPPFQPFAGSDSGKLTINGGALTGGGSYNISAASGATITAQGGAQVSFQGTNLGTSSGQEGDLQVTGAGTTWRNVAATLPAGFGGFFNVGNAAESATGLGGGVGHVTITAGASMITAFNDTIAGPAGSEGDISVTAGGSLSDSTMTVGNNGSGTLTVNGGAVTSTAFSSIGAAAAGNGAATISGNGVWNAQSVDVAQSGRGTMTVNTGTLLASGNVIVGASSGALGVASVTTGTIAAGGGVQIGSSGTGTATVNAGGTILSGGSSNSVGANPGGVGELRILGGGIFRSTVAAASSSSFNIGSSGTSGTTPGALGAVVVSGLGSQLDMAGHGLFVGNNGGTGSLIVAQGGTVQAGTPDSNVSSALQVGAAAGGSGAITVTDTGSVLDVSGFGLIGQSGFGKLVVKNSGSVAISAAPANGGSFFIGTGFTGTTSAASRLGGSGEVDVTSSGALTTPNAISVGGNGNAGVLNVNSGGGVQVGTSLSVAPASLITGTIYGGTGQVNIGAGGTINITGTPTTNFPAVVVGTNNASLGVDATGQSQGILTISGAGALLDTGGTGLTAGAIGQGTILISQGGSLVLGSPVSSVQGAFNIARYGNASLTITDPGSQITSNGGGYIGRAGDGALVVENHAIFNIGTDPTGSGGLGLGGAGFLNNNTLAVSGIGTGLITGSGTLTVASNINVGQNGSSGSLTINNGGYVSTAQRILIAQGTTIPLGGGILATASGTTAVAANTVIGSDGGIHVGAGGTLIASGGSITAAGTSAIGIAGVVGTTGHLDVSGAGALVQSFASRIGVGTAGDATMSVSQGGTVLTATPYANDDAIYTGFSLGATGVVTVTDPGSKLTATGQFAVGVSGQGSLLVENQGTVFTGSNAADASQGVEIAQKAGAGGTATVTGANSLLTNTGRFVVGDGGLGGLSIAAGGAVTTTPGAVVGLAGMVIANASAASGSAVNVTGANSNLRVTGSLVVGNAAYGQLSISQSATVSADNVDAAASAGGDGAITVTDAGSALNISGLLTVGDQSSGSLNIVNGATVTAGGLSIGTGASGSGNVVIGPGSHLTLTGTTINVGLAGSGVLDVQGGTLALVAGTTLSPGTFGRIVQVGGLIDPATVFDASGGSFGGGGTAEASGTIVNSSLASVSGGAETLLAPLITSSDAANVAGVWSIKSGGTLVLDVNTFDNSQTISFGDLTGVLTIGQQVTLDATQTPQPIAASALSGFAAPIVGYKAGDKITFNGLNVASDQVSGNVVTLFDSGNNNLGSLTFQTSKGGADKAGATAAATQITQGVTCFAEGTRIETENGPQAVETLREGDLVVTRDGTYEPVVWIGQRAVNCAAHPRPETVWPVRVAAGAFGDNVPVRDLYLSPDHAVFVNDVLVPVKLLINSTSITSLKRDHVTYFHVELPRHDVILAEGLTVESYLDLGDRTNFERGSGTIRLHPDFTARLAPDAVLVWETRGAAKLVMAGQALEVAREFLAGQAGPSRGHGGRDVQAVS